MFLNPSLTFYFKMFNSPKTGIGALKYRSKLTWSFAWSSSLCELTASRSAAGTMVCPDASNCDSLSPSVSTYSQMIKL